MTLPAACSLDSLPVTSQPLLLCLVDPDTDRRLVLHYPNAASGRRPDRRRCRERRCTDVPESLDSVRAEEEPSVPVVVASVVLQIGEHLTKGSVRLSNTLIKPLFSAKRKPGRPSKT